MSIKKKLNHESIQFYYSYTPMCMCIKTERTIFVYMQKT